MTSAIFMPRRAQPTLIAECRSAETSMVNRFIATGDPYSFGGLSLTARLARVILPSLFILRFYDNQERTSSGRGVRDFRRNRGSN